MYHNTEEGDKHALYVSTSSRMQHVEILIFIHQVPKHGYMYDPSPINIAKLTSHLSTSTPP